ncbi:T6SS immunity protein Tli4 family protein [Cupriavidus nantongensis]
MTYLPLILLARRIPFCDGRAYGAPYQPAFQSDDDALQLWDAIIDSIRLRPGAV